MLIVAHAARVKLLTYQAEYFRWTPFSQTLEDAVSEPGPGSFTDAVVVFMHVEAGDVEETRRPSVFRQTLKHIKWLANKRKIRNVVLHSFAHLGGQTAPADAAEAFILELEARLAKTDYTVEHTPFGWFCSWEIGVYGDSLAKVFKEI